MVFTNLLKKPKFDPLSVFVILPCIKFATCICNRSVRCEKLISKVLNLLKQQQQQQQSYPSCFKLLQQQHNNRVIHLVLCIFVFSCYLHFLANRTNTKDPKFF